MIEVIELTFQQTVWKQIRQATSDLTLLGADQAQHSPPLPLQDSAFNWYSVAVCLKPAEGPCENHLPIYTFCDTRGEAHHLHSQHPHQWT